MVTIRRGYVLLTAALALQASTWAVISLVRNLVEPLGGAPSPTMIAFQIAVTVVTLPIYAGHWLWAQRLAASGPDERGAVLRRVYLYGTLALLTGPLAANAHGLLTGLLRRAFGLPSAETVGAVEGGAVVDSLAHPVVAVLVLGLLLVYHRREVLADRAAVPEVGGGALMRRLYMLGYAAAGLGAMASGSVLLARRVLPDFMAVSTVTAPLDRVVVGSAAQALVGAGLWAAFWTWAQRLYRDGGDDERRSAVRKLLLYAVVAVGVLTVAANAGGILAGSLRVALGLAPEGDIRDALAPMLVAAVAWGYFARVLRDDAASAADAPRQVSIRRLYRYLIAGIGGAATLIGAAGIVRALAIAATSSVVVAAVKDQLATAAAAVVVGVPLWVLPWWRIQAVAVAGDPVAEDERQSTIRKLFLYLVLFVTGVTTITSAVYLVYRLVSWMLGVVSPAPLSSDVAQAIGYIAIAATAWIYHLRVIRVDGDLQAHAASHRLAGRRVVLVDPGGDVTPVVDAVGRALGRDLPDLRVEVARSAEDDAVRAAVASADAVVVPWDLARPETGPLPGAGAPPAADLAAAVAASPAAKLVLPTRRAGWEWIGVDRWSDDDLAAQTAHAVHQWLAGEPLRPARPLGAGGVLAIVVVVAAVLLSVGVPVMMIVSGLE